MASGRGPRRAIAPPHPPPLIAPTWRSQDTSAVVGLLTAATLPTALPSSRRNGRSLHRARANTARQVSCSTVEKTGSGLLEGDIAQ